VPSTANHRRALGEKVKFYRKLAGFTQEKLAEKAEIAASYLSDIERGRENVSIDTLARIAKALSVKFEDLFSGF
jgi:transcriptional regulator with XRE-family HTH domain